MRSSSFNKSACAAALLLLLAACATSAPDLPPPHANDKSQPAGVDASHKPAAR